MRSSLPLDASFPIPAASPEKQKAVEGLVDRILAAKRRDDEADTSALDQEKLRLDALRKTPPQSGAV